MKKAREQEKNRLRPKSQQKKKKGILSGAEERWSPLYVKMGILLLAVSAVALLVFCLDNTQPFPQDESGSSVVTRNSHGGGDREEELEVSVGDVKETVTVKVGEQEYSQGELDKVFRNAEEMLEELVLGENQSLDEVRSSLELINKIPDTGITVSWELDNYEVMNLQGELKEENLTDEGTLVKLTALLNYKEEMAESSFYARVYPPKLNQTEKLIQKLGEEIERLDQETKQEEKLILPSVVDGIPVTWSYGKNFRAAALLLIGIAMTLFLYVSEQEKQKDQKKKRDVQMALDYPQMVSKLTLYLGAGMTVRKAWYRIAQDYENQKEEKGRREVYEEMLYTMHEIQGGGSEGECYERFGERCALPAYKKFGAMLSQNLKKGTKGLASLLKQEADNAFEERKSLARRLGEEAGTKMLIPMFLMLAVVLVMIVVPAFFSIQI